MELVAPVARVLLALTFIMAGIGHFANRAALAEHARRSGIPAPGLSVVGSGGLLLIGGTLVLLGWNARIGAALLGVFLLAVSFTVHRFWTIDDPVEAGNQQAHFMKNLGLLGAVLLILFFGPGPYSLGS